MQLNMLRKFLIKELKMNIKNNLSLKNIMEEYNFRPKKKLGQNFLHDKNIIKSIIKEAKIKGENIIEIGPGQGAITNKLHNRVNKLVAVEIDPLLCEPLKETLSSETQIIKCIRFSWVLFI